MGYTHYWRRPPRLDQRVFSLITADFKKLLPEMAKAGVRLAGPDGVGTPRITKSAVDFNGPVNCGHPADFDLAIPWPDRDAAGVFAEENPVSGTWFAGHTLATRFCPGDCSYESFYFPRVYRPETWETPDADGRYFFFCKTAFRPYDLAVNAFLIIAKYHLGNAICVKSDGTEENWFDAKLLCHMVLGYGLGFSLDE